MCPLFYLSTTVGSLVELPTGLSYGYCAILFLFSSTFPILIMVVILLGHWVCEKAKPKKASFFIGPGGERWFRASMPSMW